MRMPFYIDMAGKRILIIGGGKEGAKRAAKYAESGARVTILAEHFDSDLQLVASRGAVDIIQGNVTDSQRVEKLISNSDLVMVALDTKEFNEALVAMGRRAHKLINLTNDAAATEVVVPVESEVHGVRLAATSEGKSVHVAREALQRAVHFLEGEGDLWVLLELMQELRQLLRERGLPLEVRMRIYPEVYRDQCVREEAGKRNLQGAREAMYAAVNRLLASRTGSGWP